MPVRYISLIIYRTAHAYQGHIGCINLRSGVLFSEEREESGESAVWKREKRERLIQSTVRKKMAAIHFTTIPCEPNIGNRQHRRQYFGEIYPCTNKIVYARLEVFKPYERS